MLVLQSLFLLQRGNWQTVQAVITGQKDLHNKCIMKNDDPNYAFPDCAVEPLLNFYHHHHHQHHHHDDHDHHCHHHSRGRTFYHCFLFGSSHLSWLSHFGLVHKSITSQVFWSCQAASRFHQNPQPKDTLNEDQYGSVISPSWRKPPRLQPVRPAVDFSWTVVLSLIRVGDGDEGTSKPSASA